MSIGLTPFLNIGLTSAISNQTNLALKGMIGIQAMAVIANETGHTSDAASYSSIAHDYITQWQELGINKDASPPHTTLSYGDANSHGKSHFAKFHLHGQSLLTIGPRSSLQSLCRCSAWSQSGSAVRLPDAE